MTVVLDTDALLALAQIDDAHHLRARDIAQSLVERQATIVVSPTTLTEFALLCAKRIGLAPAKRLVQGVLEEYRVFDLNYDVMAQAVTLYHQQNLLAESLFDCVVMVVARQVQADAIFSFDKGYTKKRLHTYRRCIGASIRQLLCNNQCFFILAVYA